MMKRLFPLIAALLATIGPVLADDLTGQASVIDGDTIDVRGRGEDSLQYRCGAMAANDLDAFIARRPVSCTPISLDQYGRTVATYTVGGTDLGQWLVSNGLALDWPNYSHGMYDKNQREAEHAGRGIWSGSYVAPWLYRACIRAGGRPSDCSDDANANP
jgi:endonuclease YncB( thermonuclease family)